MRKLDFKPIEIGLIIIALLLLVPSSVLFVTGIPLRQYLLGIQVEESNERVGTLGRASGNIRRKSNSGATFESVSQNAALYNQDTIVTGPDAGAIITLDDGGTIELGPNTMVKLQFENNLSLAGISRSASVDVVAGRVAGSSVVLRSGARTLGNQANIQLPSAAEMASLAAKKPSLPTQKVAPVPTSIPRVKPEVKIVAPTEGGTYLIDKGSKTPEKKMTLAWKVSPPDADLSVRLVRRTEKGVESVLTETVRAKEGKGSISTVLSIPGEYEWMLATPDPKLGLSPDSKFRSNFKIDPAYQSIETLEPLIAGAKVRSNEVKNRLLKDFDITLRWKKHPMAGNYIVRIFKGPNDKEPIMERQLRDTEFILNKNKVYAGTMYYQVDAPLKSGFVATSGRIQFGFEFKPPIQVLPTDNRALSRDDLANENNKILFTWQKTNFTDFYVLEISTDPKFEKAVTRHETKENFLVVDAPRPGRYWWRIKSVTGRLTSTPSPGRSLILAMDQAPRANAPKRPAPRPRTRGI